MSLIDDIDTAMKFLETTVRVSDLGPVEVYHHSSNPRSVEDGFIVTVNASNKATPRPGGPQVVFLGINFVVRGDAVVQGRGRWWYSPELVKNGDEPRPNNPATISQQRTGGQEFPLITGAERDLGLYLFPGQSLSYMYTVPKKAMDGLAFDVEATLSRRHLFHVQRTLKL